MPKTQGKRQYTAHAQLGNSPRFCYWQPAWGAFHAGSVAICSSACVLNNLTWSMPVPFLLPSVKYPFAKCKSTLSHMKGRKSWISLYRNSKDVVCWLVLIGKIKKLRKESYNELFRRASISISPLTLPSNACWRLFPVWFACLPFLWLQLPVQRKLF